MRDAVLVLAPQPERRADLGADGVAAALAARDHDDPAPDAELLVPHAARADDARVVVRMGPFAHHVDLHRVVGGVRRRRRRASGCRHGDRDACRDRREPGQHRFRDRIVDRMSPPPPKERAADSTTLQEVERGRRSDRICDVLPLGRALALRSQRAMKIAVLGGGGFRVPMVYGALLARAERLGLEQVSLLRRRRVAPRADRARARRARGGARRAARVSRRRRASTTRSTAPTSSSARSASATSRAASSTSASRSTRASSARRRPGPGGLCFALRTVPVMVELARARRRARAARVVRQLHESGRASSPRRSARCSATARSGSATRRRASAAASRRRSAGDPTSSGSTTSG